MGNPIKNELLDEVRLLRRENEKLRQEFGALKHAFFEVRGYALDAYSQTRRYANAIDAIERYLRYDP